MLTCIIQYDIDPTKRAAFETYGQNWATAIPRCGADLVGYFAPHEGSATRAYGIYHIENLAAYEAYRARLAADPLGRENYLFAQSEKFILKEDRTWLRNVSHPKGGHI
ncbi:NIPSNAP family protein [uncultured Tateyamaria sp.]|uniref:NIPSNAP family protein n=1 Tax=uncultured Tateyamaria sp. TaxID=455651 RepID=UPI00261EF0C7|nr:NIPSNAP family protein [uncultured Tateyamaria sp.]